MIYVIDHKDSFTHNVVHQFSYMTKLNVIIIKLSKTKLKKATTMFYLQAQVIQRIIHLHLNYIISLRVIKK